MISIDGTRHLFSIDSLSRDEILAILDAAEAYSKAGVGSSDLLGRVVCLMFLQTSLRTSMGFDVAVKRLGGDTTLVRGPKGEHGMGCSESLDDALRVISGYCDAVVVRHPSSAALLHALRYVSVPVINAGTGDDHHPTQALIDLYCIRTRLGRLTDLRIGLVGDLYGSRAARSLIQALVYWPPAEVRLMAPPGRSIDDECISTFGPGIVTSRTTLSADGLDVLYVAGLPNPQHLAPYDISLRAALGVTPGTLEALPKHGIVLCTLPRIDEIDHVVDEDPKAAYFEQSDGGLRVRMAVMANVMNTSKPSS